jgi:DNA-binding MarR family transcriptional regulator
VGGESKDLSGIVNNLRRLFQVILEKSRRAEEETGLTGSQLWAMKEVAAVGSLRCSELARRLFIHPATVVNLVDRLEQRGLVIRVRSASDRRVVLVELTEQGRMLVATAPDVAQDLLVKGLVKLSREKVEQIDEGLRQLVTVLGVEHAVPEMIMARQEADGR